MVKQLNLKRFACMVIAILFMTVITSCTSDEFFGIEEDYKGMSFSTLEKIAYSKEYIEYEKISLSLFNTLQSVDTTNMVSLHYFGGEKIYANKQIISVKSLIEARQELLALFPEYENVNKEEKNQIFNLAIMNNKSLRKMAERHNVVVRGTKSTSPESKAYLYAQSVEGAININNHTWRLGRIYWYTDDSFEVIRDMALSRAEDGREHGGYIFGDNSAILNEDLDATQFRMTFYWNESAPHNMQPIMDFHIHPNGVIAPSDSDIIAWDIFDWNIHFIMDREGNGLPFD